MDSQVELAVGVPMNESAELGGSSEAPESQGLGVGPLPDGLDSLNWNALFWGPLWALAYRVWPWFWLLVGVWFARVVVFGAMYSRLRLADPPRATLGLIVVTVISTLVGLVPHLWLGVVANRTLWSRQASDPRPVRVDSFMRSQHNWTIVWLCLAGVTVLAEVLNSERSSELRATSLSSYLALGLGYCAIWLWTRGRRVTNR